MNKRFVAILFLSITPIFAQMKSDSLSFLRSNFQNNNIRSEYNKLLSVSNLISGLKYGINQNNYFLGLNSIYKSTLTTSDKNTKDEQYHTLMGEYSIDKTLSSGLFLNYAYYNDERNLAINKASNISTNFYLKYSPFDVIKIIPYAGYVVNTQIGERDAGANYGAELLMNKLSIDDITLTISGKYENEDISPRKNTIRNLNASIGNYLAPSLGNSFNAHYSEGRKDFYFQSDSSTANEFAIINNIQSRTEKNYLFQDQVTYNPGANFRFGLDGKVGWRNIDRHTRYVSLTDINTSSFDTKIEEFRLNFNSNFQYHNSFLTSMFKIDFAEKEEKYLAKPIEGADEIFYQERQRIETKKNNSSKLTTLSFANVFNLSEKDEIILSLLHRKLVYDTPSEENFDDRDELLSTVQLSYNRKYSPFFDLYVSLDGSINHMVYIYAERSSNNNIKRILKLSSGGTYSGAIIRSKNKADVSVNYTVFDFEDLTPNFQSFAFRQFAFWDSTSIKINNHSIIDFEGYLKLSDQGDFFWSDFKSKPIRNLQESFLHPSVKYLYHNLLFGVGFRYFSLKTFLFDRSGNEYLSSEYKSIGPTSEIKYKIIDKLKISCYGWYEFITTENDSKREQVNLTLRVNWNI